MIAACSTSRRQRLAFAMAGLLCLLAGSLFAADYVLRTDPPLAGAAVYVDSTFHSTTDENGKVVLTNVAPGNHQLTLELDGATYSAPYVFDPELSDLRPFDTSKVAPLPVSAQLTIESNAPDATIYVNGSAVARTDAAGRWVLPLTPNQTYEVALQKQGLVTETRSVHLGAGATAVRFDLRAGVEKSRLDPVMIGLVIVLIISLAVFIVVLVRTRSRRGGSDAVITDRQAVHFDRYRLINTIGSGGVGMIYRAADEVDKSTVALKILDARWLSDTDMVRKFLAEGEALEAIRAADGTAPVVRCFRYGREHGSIGGRPFIALELLEGETLDVRLKREPILNELTAIGIGFQIARALQAVHAVGIVHRDLTPDNVFLRQGEVAIANYVFNDVPSVVLIDFGIAKLDVLQKYTMDGSIAGKPQFMSPEQCRGSRVDARSDLYSLGIILYQMVSSRTPFAGRDAFDVMRAQQHDAPAGLPPSVSRAYADLVFSLLNKKPDERPRTAAQVAAQLEQLFVAAATTGAFKNLVRFPERRRSV